MNRHVANISAVTLLCLGVAAYTNILAADPVSDTTLPTGGQVAAGQVGISQSGSQMSLLQSSDRAVVNWQSFDVGSDAAVQFLQPSATASILNRVSSQAPSQILGKITANGQVFILNASGVIFGRDAQVDVGSMVAGAMKITDENYLNGNQVFADGQGAVINQGSLTAAEGGLIALLAPEVINEGVIRAKLGTIVLAAGEAITLTNSLTGVTVVVEQSAIDALVDNRHLISAEDGTVFISARDAAELQASVVTNSGVIQARSARQVGGLIRLEAGVLLNTGVLDASSSAGNGGSIEIIAEKLSLSGAELKVNGALKGGEIHLSATDISLSDDTRLSAVGDIGGGDIAIGGGWQGASINDRPAAVTVLVGSEVLLDASAAMSGDGGDIVLWSDVGDQQSQTRVSGAMRATGGVMSGQGGRIETSGHYLDVAGVRVDTQAQNGDAGLWLLDPANIVISQSTTLNTAADSAGTFTPTSGSNDSVIQVDDILTALASSNVTITTTNENVAGTAAGNINIQTDIAYTGSKDRSLTLIADNEINQDAATAISSANATLNLVLDNAVGGVVAGTIGAPGGDDVSITKQGAGILTLTGTNTYTGGTTISAGELQLGAGSTIGSITGDIANAGTLIFNRSDDITFSGVISGTGDLVQGGSGVLTLNGENLYSGSTELAAGTLSLGSAAAIGELGVIGFSGGSLRHSALNVTDYSPRFSTLSGHVQFDIDTGGEDVSYGSPLDTVTSTITKRGLGSLTLSDSSRYVGTVVGSTSISAGTLVLKVADITTLTSAERISGLGSLAIVPLTTSFSADFSLGDLNLGANDGSVIGNLTVGAPGNTANIILNDLPGNLVVTDNQSYYAGTVTIPNGASPGITAMTSGVLTLSAQTSVSILEPITVSGSGGVAIQTSQNAASGGTGTYDLGVSATGFLGGISFDNSTGQTFTTQDGTNVANLKNYNLVGSLAELSSASLSGNIALKNSLDAASYVITNSDSSISNYGNVLAGQFTGTFTGLGNTIVNLVLRKTSDESGIFQSIRNAKLSDLRVLDSSVVGRNHTGLIVGRAYSTVSLSGLVVDASSISGDSNPHFIGALVGYADSGTLNNSWVVDSAVSGYYMVGGLIGHSRISADGVHNLNTDVSATNNYLGGLYGYTPGATTINNSSSSGAISGINYVGGLVGGHDGAVSNSFVTGSVSATGVYVGGLMGHHRNGNLNNVYMTGDVSGGGERVGGLVGWLSPNISFVNSYVSGAVSGRNRVGGLAGYSDSQLLIDNSYFSGASVTGSSGNSVAGFIGEIAGNLTIQDAYVSTPLIQSTGGGYVGGFVGYARSAVTISDSYVTTALISGTANYIGGLVGHTDSAATINRAYVAASGGTAVTGVSFVAGLTGRINGAGYISDSYFGGSVAATGTNYGGLVGYIMPNTYIANSYYDIDNSLINGVKTVSIGGLFAGQYADWVNSSQTLSSRSLAIGNYFSAPDTNGYYAISSYIDNSNEAGGNPSGQSDLSNLLGFIESGSASQTNGFKFKLANDIDMATASIPYLPYLSVTELLGNGFEVNNFSWNRPTSSVGFIGHAYKSLLVDMTVNTSVYSGQTDTSYAINAEDYVGTLVGSIFDGRIENSHTILAGTVLGNTIVGGAVGMITNSPVITASAVRAAGVVAADAQVVSVGDYVGGFAGLVTTGAMQGVDSDLSIQGSAAYVGGLVGKANGTIADVSAIGDVVGANDYVGGLIGYQATGSVTNATAIGDVIGSSRVGGLLGYSNSNVTKTQASGEVAGGLRYVGGLIGKQVSGTVSDSSYLTGTVSGQGYVGGLIGHVDNKSAVVLGSYSTGGVSASADFVGGLIGFMEGSLGDSVTAQPTSRGSLHSYATGNVTGRYDVGGLIGRLASTGLVANSYASGDVTAAANYGGVLGYLTPGATVTNTHYDMGSVSLSAFTTASPSALVDVTGTVTLGGLYSGQYTTWFNGGALDGLGSPEVYFGAADSAGVYSLSTIQHLKDYLGFADQASLSFKLTADFDLAADTGFYIPYVSGLLDTNGVSVSNLMLDQLTSNLGFVGHYYSASDTNISGLTLSGEITGMMNLGLAAGSTWQRGFNLVSGSGSVTGSNIAYANLATNEDELSQNNYGYSNVGGLLGYGWGSASTPLSLSNLASSAHVLGGNNVGGLAGYIEYGAMSGSSSTGTVESIAMSGYTIYRTGGLVGWLNQRNSSLHSSSHSVGLVKGFNYVGGLVGEFRGALGEAVVDATPTYSTWVSSSVEGSGQRIGGLVGYHASGSLTNAEMTGSVTGWITDGTTNFSGTYTGGITGYSSPGITYSRYAGSLIKGGERTGGIVGQIDTTMSNVIASGQVLGGGSYVGGIAGYGRRIQDAVSTADIFGQSNFVGGLAGQADAGIFDSSASGQVSGHTNASGLNFAATYVGGLVGYSNNVISNSYATGSLVKGGHQTGGLVGHTDNHIYDSYATADVVTNSSFAGGLVGYSNNIVYDSYATGDVTTNNAYSGGLGGYVRAIYDSYATGNVTSTSSYVGGLTGTLKVADNAYATGTVSGSSYVGGFVGEQQGGGTVSDSYATGAVTSNGSQVGGFAGRANGAISNSFANGSVVGSTFAGGFVGYQNSGSIINSFTNSDVSAVGDYVGGFVGYQNSGRITNTSSTGSVYTPARNYVGGFVGQSNGTITDSTVVISTVNETSGFGVFGDKHIGGFSGYNQGAISNSTATASIKGQSSTGGFVGLNVAGTISFSGAFGRVTGTNAVGGFAGRVNAGTISSSYSNSLVVGSSTDATTFIGGFVGYVVDGAITTSRAAGAVSGNYRVGGFVGSMFGSGSIGQSYATGAVTQYSTSTAGTSGGVGGFAGYLDDAQTGALTDIYAMGSVTGTQQVGGLVGYAGRGTITNGFSTGAVSSSSGATSIGGALGVVNQTFLANTSTLPVTQSAVYFDTDSSGLLQDGAGGTSVGQATIELKSVLPSNFNQLNWSTSTDLYPYLSVFYPITPHAISGLASLSNGEVAVAAQVNHYSHGVLLNGGAASTGADGSYYSIVGSRSLMPDANVPGAIESITLNSGGSGYTSVPILTLADSAGFNALGSVTLGANQMITDISFTAGNGSGATATASIDTDSLSATFRTVNDINLITAGDYYTSRPVLTFAGGTTGTVATATVTTRSLLASTLLGSTLTLNGSTDVAGLSYSDSLTLNNGNLSDSLVQGLSVIRTNALSDSLLSADLDLTFGSAVRAEFQDALTQRSSLELIAEGESFDLDLALDYRDGNLANAGNITVTNNALTLSAGSFYSSGFQTYMGAMTLASDTLVTATTLNTSSILTGSLTSLEIDGNFDAGGALSGLTTLLVRGDTVLAGTVSTSDDQTYLGDLVLDSAANTLIITEVGSVGGSLNVSGAITSSGAVHDLTVLAGQGAITFAGDIGGGLGFDHINLSANTLALSGVEATQSVDITVATNGSVASIAGAANLIKNGAGTLSLNAVNTYSGSTHINSGSLALINAGSLGQGNYAQVIDIANNATFQYASSGEQILSGVLSGGGTLVKDTADSTLTLTGVNTFAGDIDLDAGVLLVGASGQLGSGAYTGAMDIADGATFQYASDAAQTLSGV
ncbi:filamentous hemagglutinin N-terminal domain-containing protein, partial [Pseudomonadales bacterium]|nr:filamentous hemagglutinin N-terminal domain-containing protein [Pseudomonadales bacterium]